MFEYCPGAAGLHTPTLTIRTCPQCGAEIEIFSNEVKAVCENCGFVIYQDIQSCVQWCKYARQCVGEETYQRIIGEKE
jgi:NADH pyrophosphatase NudC (nudix superfamily)